MKTESDEQLWDYYQRVNTTYLEKTSIDKITMLAKSIKRHTKAEDRLCEIGLGSGLMLKELARCRNVMGVDLCEGTISRLGSQSAFSKIPLTQGDICGLSSICKNMDAVITIDVIEHLFIEQLEKACEEVYKVLNSGGKWFISVPWNENLKLNEVFCAHCHKAFHRVGHKLTFDEQKITDILTKAKFRMVFIKKIYPANFSLPLPLMWMYRMVARIYFKYYASMFVVVQKD
jgi:cyclopropane fatty-acyl-phospholipid synthase-like methyltransferase